jgi:mannose-6-phosphate isomerase-like protein (cupin superfamily)
MKIFRYNDLLSINNPNTADSPYRIEVLTKEHNALALGGMFGLLPPNIGVPYHYHKERESILIILSGEGIEIIEEKETKIYTGDVLFIPAMEKHTIKNTGNEDLRFIEFFTNPPLSKDFYTAI